MRMIVLFIALGGFDSVVSMQLNQWRKTRRKSQDKIKHLTPLESRISQQFSHKISRTVPAPGSVIFMRLDLQQNWMYRTKISFRADFRDQRRETKIVHNLKGAYKASEIKWTELKCQFSCVHVLSERSELIWNMSLQFSSVHFCLFLHAVRPW